MRDQFDLLSTYDEPRHPLAPMLAPRSVALIGASRKRNTVGNDMMRNLIPSCYPGPVYPVNPSYNTLYGYRCFPDIASVPEPVDLAVLSVPNRVLEQVVADAIEAGVKALVIFASAELEGEIDSLLRERVAARSRRPAFRSVVPTAWASSTPSIR